VSEIEALFGVLRQSGSGDSVAAIERTVRDAHDRELCRINVLDFAAKHGLDEERAIAAFLHAARLGLFELSWSVLCPGCGGVLNESATLKSVHREKYDCELCAVGHRPTLDEMVEVTFTVSPRVRLRSRRGRIPRRQSPRGTVTVPLRSHPNTSPFWIIFLRVSGQTDQQMIRTSFLVSSQPKTSRVGLPRPPGPVHEGGGDAAPTPSGSGGERPRRGLFRLMTGYGTSFGPSVEYQ
jgi:hypothetical protein